jgi:hypothetical protein
MPIIPDDTGSLSRRNVVQASSGKNKRPYPKITTAKRAGGMIQVIECTLPSKYEAQSSNSSTSKNILVPALVYTGFHYEIPQAQ